MKQETKDLIQKLVRKGSYNQSEASILAKCELIQIALTNPEILASEGLSKQEYTNQFKQPLPSTEGETLEQDNINKKSAEIGWDAGYSKASAEAVWMRENDMHYEELAKKKYNELPDKQTFLSSLPETDNDSKLREFVEWLELCCEKTINSTVKLAYELALDKAKEILNQ